MPDYEALKARVQESAEKAWDRQGIETWFKKLAAEGIPKKTLNRDEILANREQILEHVQRRGEEGEFLSHS